MDEFDDSLRPSSCDTTCMASTLRALTSPDWNTLSYAQLRNRVEGVALGLLAREAAPVVFSSTRTLWDWAAELAAAASGLAWAPTGEVIPAEVLGGPHFNHEDGRGPYHTREQLVQPATPFTAGLDQGELMARLRRLNILLGWDHDTIVALPLPRLGDAPVRAALWSAVYAGAHAVVSPQLEWDATPFLGLWSPD